MATALPLDASLAKLLEAQARLEERIAAAPAGSIHPLLILKARWSCEGLGDVLRTAEERWMQSRRAAIRAGGSR